MGVHAQEAKVQVLLQRKHDAKQPASCPFAGEFGGHRDSDSRFLGRLCSNTFRVSTFKGSNHTCMKVSPKVIQCSRMLAVAYETACKQVLFPAAKRMQDWTAKGNC
eukprot:2164661-Amphidinium_carterae.3